MGCGIVGYSTFKMEEWNMPQQPANFEKTEISLYGKNQEVEGYYVEASHFEPYFGLTKVLRERFKIADVFSESQNRFLIKIEESIEGRRQNKPTVWELIHIYTFNVIPYIWTDKRSITYTITAPNNEIKSFTHSYVVQNYSWFPFLFFNPGFETGLYGEMHNYYQKDRVKIYEVFATRFLTESALFIVSHR